MISGCCAAFSNTTFFATLCPSIILLASFDNIVFRELVAIIVLFSESSRFCSRVKRWCSSRRECLYYEQFPDFCTYGGIFLFLLKAFSVNAIRFLISFSVHRLLKYLFKEKCDQRKAKINHIKGKLEFYGKHLRKKNKVRLRLE